ncbi:hypothetical protein NW752_006890 [Fusarium irregulare]|uniref:Uncharacterized protein n=1 Tax=Fusarium irregulare TaxID=2494466 RepID=A0A9W8PRL4_9HYPO|nr:hypothetical protein NW766_005769 [Fusarium irregulare]KAJ4015957.1 hypothetical protein NW752_006890 [Fusarium irregulare]
MPQSIRIVTVDDSQGEEAKVIIVHLVRSKHKAKRNPPVDEFEEAKPFPLLFVPGSATKSPCPGQFSTRSMGGPTLKTWMDMKSNVQTRSTTMHRFDSAR